MAGSVEQLPSDSRNLKILFGVGELWDSGM